MGPKIRARPSRRARRHRCASAAQTPDAPREQSPSRQPWFALDGLALEASEGAGTTRLGEGNMCNLEKREPSKTWGNVI